MRDAVRNKERWKGAVRLPKILVLTGTFTGTRTCTTANEYVFESRREWPLATMETTHAAYETSTIPRLMPMCASLLPPATLVSSESTIANLARRVSQYLEYPFVWRKGY